MALPTVKLMLAISVLTNALTTAFGFNLGQIPTTPSIHQRDSIDNAPTRRDFISASIASTASTIVLTSSFPSHATSAADAAAITDKIFVEFKGLSFDPGEKDRIVIGLFGNDAPQPVSILKQLASKDGYKSKCKPLDTSRVLQKEQLEANKVYNSCIENEDIYGVNYDYSSVWRVIPNQRIDIGAVTVKFVARENPNFEDTKSSALHHDAPGIVSVRRGNDSGFGFTIYPGGGDATILNEDNIVVGKVIEGMDVVQKLNDIPVVKNALAGNQSKAAPSRACRYGGSELYCNENKPLKKVLIETTGNL